MNILFYIAAFVAIIATIMVITGKHAVHSLLYLIVSLLSVAVIFYLFGAPFVAALEVIIYAGAIMILFVFVVMMLNLGKETVKQEKEWTKPKAWIGPSILALILLGELIYVFSAGFGEAAEMSVIGPKEVGIALYGPYILGVELTGLLLMAGIVGAYHIGREKQKEYHRFLREDNEGIEIKEEEKQKVETV